MLQKSRGLVLFELGETYVNFLASVFNIWGENDSVRVCKMAKIVEQK